HHFLSISRQTSSTDASLPHIQLPSCLPAPATPAPPAALVAAIPALVAAALTKRIVLKPAQCVRLRSPISDGLLPCLSELRPWLFVDWRRVMCDETVLF
ncbi:hypothetical protein ASPACDRAFT_74839, partial [Aspergillus aculeatus ATCC 16872]